MARGFADGFQSGFSLVNSAKRAKQEEEELKLRKQSHEKQMQLTDQQIAAGERTARLNNEIDTENAGIRTYMSGGFEQGRNGPADESAAMYGVNAGSRLQQPMDPSNPDHQVGLNRRIISAAALKGDYTTVQALQEKNREISEMKVFNQAVQQFSTDPNSFTDYERWVNKNNPMISVAPSKDPRTGQLTGYNIMTVGPTGDAVHKFISPQQAATLAGATALMQVNPTKALQLIGTVDQSMASAIQLQNTAVKDTTTTGNTATHYANQDQTARMNAQANQTQANAAADNAKTNKERAGREKQTEGQKLQEKVDAYAGILMRQNPQMSKQEADKKAADIMLRNPETKDDIGLAEAGIFKRGGKYYTLGKNGQPQEVKFPGESATERALKDLAAKGGDPFAQKPKNRREVSGKVE